MGFGIGFWLLKWTYPSNAGRKWRASCLLLAQTVYAITSHSQLPYTCSHYAGSPDPLRSIHYFTRTRGPRCGRDIFHCFAHNTGQSLQAITLSFDQVRIIVGGRSFLLLHPCSTWTSCLHQHTAHALHLFTGTCTRNCVQCSRNFHRLDHQATASGNASELLHMATFSLDKMADGGM